MLIRAVRTGRKAFGDNIAPSEASATVAGVKLTVTESDTWSSGEHAGDGEYIRCTWIKGPKVDPWPNIKDRPAIRALKENG